MRPTWLFAGLLAGGMGLAAAQAADEPAKEAPKPPDGWVDYTPRDTIFSVWLPKGGKRTERTDTVPLKDARVRVNIIDLETDGKGKYVARSFLINVQAPLRPPVGKIGKGGIGKVGKGPAGPPPGMGPAAAQAMAEAARDVFLKEVKGKVADETDVTLGDFKGKEYQITIDSKTAARLRVFATGHLIYQVGVVGTKEQVEGKDADTFLDSFRGPKEK